MPPRPKAPKHTYWRGEVLWSRFSVCGREYRESLRTGDIKTARTRVSKMRERAVSSLVFGDNRKTWEEVVIEWSGHIANEVASTTQRRYGVSIEQIRPALAGKFVDEIGKAEILAFVRERRGHVTNATIRRDLQAMSSVLQYAELHDWRAGNPAKLIMETLTERRDPIMLPTEADFCLMKSRLSPVMSALMVAARATGARISELTQARRSQFDAQAGTLTIVGKRNKRRTIELDPDAIRLLSALPLLSGGQLFGLGETASSLFSRATRAARRDAQETGREFTGFRFHDLRHWFAVEWLKDGRSIYDLQQHLGHSSVSTTEIYLEFLTVEEKEAAKRPLEHRRAAIPAARPASRFELCAET